MDDAPKNHRLYSIRETAKILNCSVRSVWKLISKGDLPRPVKVLSSAMFTAEDIDAFIQKITEEARPPVKTPVKTH